MGVRRILAAAVGVVLVVAGTPPVYAANPAKPPPKQVSEQKVTLVTGDKVTVKGKSLRVEPAPGRDRIVFRKTQLGKKRYVIPSDAVPLVASGRLDRRLFDVAELLSLQYDDAHRADLPVIATGDAAAKAGTKATRPLASVRGSAVRLAKNTAAHRWPTLRTTTGRVWLDGRYKLSLDQSVPQIGAPAAYAAGYTGEGVTVGIVDSGIDATHPDFAGKIVEARNFTSDPDTDDTSGHGTHVASTIAGSGAASGGRYHGVAPGAKLLIAKACAGDGCYESDVLAAMQWLAESGADIVNMSLGRGDSDEVDPGEEAVNRLTAQYGTLFAVSAGNSGPGDRSLGSPATADAALAVGAVDKQNQLADFSSRGPRLGDSAVKPDVTAPGVDIVAARARNAVAQDPVGDSYMRASGTSMAAPHVAGAAALLSQQHPGWQAPQLKSLLMGSAKSFGTGVFAEGAGRIDVAQAIRQSVYADPASVTFGRIQWPHGAGQAVAKTVTYRNSGTEPVALTLSVESSAPAGLFTVEPSTITVPANGSATATVTAVPSADMPDSTFGAALVATAGSVRITTPMSVLLEEESFDLTLVHVDKNGAPNTNYATSVVGLDRYFYRDVFDADGTATVRLPRGRYLLDSLSPGGQVEPDAASVLVDPSVDLNGATTVTLDERKAKPVSITVPEASARSRQLDVLYGVDIPGVGLWGGGVEVTHAAISTATLAPFPADRQPSGVVADFLADPGPSGDYANSPYVYNLFWPTDGFPTGFQRTVKHEDLATVVSSYAQDATGVTGSAGTLADGPDLDIQSPSYRFSVPFVRSEYHSPEVGWESRYGDSDDTPVGGSGFSSFPTVFQAGKRYDVTWNGAVHGPFVGWKSDGSGRCSSTVNHEPERLSICLAPHTDTAGHLGYTAWTNERTTLYRNGAKFGEDGYLGEVSFDVPPERANYRLEVTGTRLNPRALLQTQLTAAWTFASQAPAEGSSITLVPTMSVRFTPKLDLYNRAPAGVPYVVPLTIDRQPGVRAYSLLSASVDVSYDDGKTWQAARVNTRDGRRWVDVQHPNKAGFVSLRAKTKDFGGNTFEETIIRAYEIK